MLQFAFKKQPQIREALNLAFETGKIPTKSIGIAGCFSQKLSLIRPVKG